ncbi:MAG: transposase family protein [Acetobacteraceae bacterium]
MDETRTACGAFDKTTVFLRCFRHLDDPRPHGRIIRPLDEIAPLRLLAVLVGVQTFVDTVLFDIKTLLLRRVRPFADGMPEDDHHGDVLAAFDAEQFQRRFVTWVAVLTGAPEGVNAIDGKSARRSDQEMRDSPTINARSLSGRSARVPAGTMTSSAACSSNKPSPGTPNRTGQENHFSHLLERMARGREQRVVLRQIATAARSNLRSSQSRTGRGRRTHPDPRNARQDHN